MIGKSTTKKPAVVEFLRDAPASPTFLNLPEAKRERIVAAATREFSEKGYQGASINTLVNDLGISKGSIFQYFTSKKGLFLFIFQSAVDQVRRTLVGVKEETEDLEVYERIRRSLLAGVAFVRRHPHIYRIYLKLLFDREAPQRAELLQVIRLFSAEYLGSLVRKGIDRGEIRRDLSRSRRSLFSTRCWTDSCKRIWFLIWTRGAISTRWTKIRWMPGLPDWSIFCEKACKVSFFSL